MSKREVEKRIAALENKHGITTVFWQDGAGMVTVGSDKLTQAEFDAYVEREFPPNTQIIITGCEITDKTLPDGRGEVTAQEWRKKYERK